MSTVSAHPAGARGARRRVSARGSREHGGGVVEGRDIGTVVFPDAPVKVFLTASDDERAAPPPARRGGGRARRSRSTTCSRRSTGRDRARRDARRGARRCGRRRRRGRDRHHATRPSTTSSPRSSARVRAAEVALMTFYRFVALRSCSACSRSCSGCGSSGREHVPDVGRRTSSRRRTGRSSTSRSPRSSRAARIRFMGKDELFATRCSAPVLRRARRRSRSSATAPTAARCARSSAVLAAGEPAGVFPEGTRAARARRSTTL